MQRIQKHVLKSKEILVGLEDSKRSWKVCVRSHGVVVHETSMPARYDTLRNYFQNKFPECNITVMYEAGFRGFNLYDNLVSDGWHCVVTPPHTVTQEKCSREKNDRIDCRRLAKNLENNDYKCCAVPDKQRREDRQISRTYDQITNDIIRVRNRIRRMLEFHGLDEHFKPGKWGEGKYHIVEGTLPTFDLSPSLRYSFQILFAQLQMLKQFRKQLLKQLLSLATSEGYKPMVTILHSAPGIGKLTAIRLALEWGDVTRFSQKEQFSKFTGLTPSDYSTGDLDRKGHITKQGNARVRSWLIECSWIAIKKDPVLLDKFINVVNNTGSRKKAIVAVARKLAIRLRALLITGQCYEFGLVEG